MAREKMPIRISIFPVDADEAIAKEDDLLRRKDEFKSFERVKWEAGIGQWVLQYNIVGEEEYLVEMYMTYEITCGYKIKRKYGGNRV